MVTSLGSHSPKLAAVRALLHRRGRREQQRFLFEGPTLLREAVAAGAQPEEVYATAPAFDALPAELREAIRCPVYLVAERALAKISDLTAAPGIVATAPAALRQPEGLLRSGAPALFVAVGDPGNAGALLRCAEAFGVGIVLFDEGAVDPYNPKVVRATMGSIFRQQLAVVSPERLLHAAHRYGYRIVATDSRGTPMARFVFPQPSVIVVGHERHGVAGRLPDWDAAVAIPQAGGVESLNAATAGCIVLYEQARRADALSSGLSTRKKA